MFKVGDKIVYQVSKRTACPGKRAKEVRPQRSGDYYDYVVDKFWRIQEVGENAITAITRTGKIRTIALDDPNLRRASMFECIRFRDKFNFSV